VKKHFVFFFLLAFLCTALLPLFAQTTTSAAALLGDTRIEFQLDSNSSGLAEAFPVNATATGTVASLAIFLDGSSTTQQLALGLYADNNGHPGTLLTQASTTQPQAGVWNRITVPAAKVVRGTRYWIAILGSGSGTIHFRDSRLGFCSSETSAQTSLSLLPAVWSTGRRWATCRVSAYGSGQAGSSVSVSVAVLPSSAALQEGKGQQFNASVSGTSNPAVNWKASGGSISSVGMYTAPMTAGSYVVTATSVADTTKSASAAVTVAAAATVTISIAPTSVSLTTGGSQQFTATVGGSTNTAVTWSATGGSISAAGLYTAPSTAGTFTITATSAADPTKSASAIVSVSAPQVVAVSIAPGSAALTTGGTRQFTATVTGTTNTAVTWSATGGSVVSGLYTAPNTAGTFTVTATSVADSTKSASATVTVTAPVVTVTISPTSASMLTGATQQFTASVSGSSNTAVTWSATGGSVASGLYTAPNTAGSYIITATSAADSTKSASATVTVSAPVVTVSISPTSASMQTGGTQQFTASISGSSNTAVNWSASSGSITSTGMYTAPTAAGTFTVKATSAADSTKSASATVTVSAPQVVAVNISPISASMLTGGNQQFTASVSGSSNTAVTWSATGGSVSSTGMYTAPSTGGTFAVTATSVADSTKSASATVTVSAPVVAISVSPGSASLLASATQQFTATVTGSSNTSVTWSATGGTISSGGLYTAPTAAGTYTVKATSAADSTKSASATVTVSAPVVAVAISPGSASLSASATQQFTATVTGSSNTAVSWSATGGTIASSGLYTAPAAAGTYTVKATSAADSTKSASATVTVSAPVQHSVTLTWGAETSVVGYNVYRGTVSGGPYTMINTSLNAPANYVDFSVQAGQSYFYTVTSVTSSGMESGFSSEVKAVIPTP